MSGWALPLRTNRLVWSRFAFVLAGCWFWLSVTLSRSVWLEVLWDVAAIISVVAAAKGGERLSMTVLWTLSVSS